MAGSPLETAIVSLESSTFNVTSPKISPMTVAIGAICNNGERIVVASDRMITYPAPVNVQIEPDAKKQFALGRSCLASYAGPVGDAEEILSKVQNQIGTQQPTTIQLAELIKAAYIEQKKKRIEEGILRPVLGTDFVGFQQMIVSTSASQYVGQVFNAITNHNLQVDILIAGIDSTGSQLWVSSNPGTLLSLNMIGYAAFGSGNSYAMCRLAIGQQAKATTLIDTIHNVYEAKRAAELAPGVGKATDMSIIKNGQISDIPQALISRLDSLHQTAPRLSQTDATSIQQQFGALFQ